MSLLAALRNKTFSCATAIPAIRAIPDESRIAQIAQLVTTDSKGNQHVLQERKIPMNIP